MTELARIAFEILAHAWRKRDVLLVDFKIEFGRLAGGENKGQLVIADVIDNDSWRIWPQGREDLMLDKQIYRNLETRRDAGDLERVKRQLRDASPTWWDFPLMLPGHGRRCSPTARDRRRGRRTRAGAGRVRLPVLRHVGSGRARRATCCSS